jgi:hypothetical protein
MFMFSFSSFTSSLTTIVTLREETLENVREYSKKVELMEDIKK